ncbi:hypothetical protein DMN91_003000, partial [Ooceraea biroi]
MPRGKEQCYAGIYHPIFVAHGGGFRSLRDSEAEVQEDIAIVRMREEHYACNAFDPWFIAFVAFQNTARLDWWSCDRPTRPQEVDPALQAEVWSASRKLGNPDKMQPGFWQQASKKRRYHGEAFYGRARTEDDGHLRTFIYVRRVFEDVQFGVKVLVRTEQLRASDDFLFWLLSYFALRKIRTYDAIVAQVRTDFTLDTMALLFAIIVISIATAMSLPPVIRI